MKYGTTSYNRIVCASPPYGGSGFRSLGRLRLPRSLHPHFFVRWNCFAISLSRTKKTSHTTGTLCEIQTKCMLDIE